MRSATHLSAHLSLSCIQTEADNLMREVMTTCDFIDRMSDVNLKLALDDIQRSAERIATLARAEERRLVEHLNRHAVTTDF